MDISLEFTGLLGLVFLTGLSAGLCFTWFNAITPGIGRMDDMNYLMSFQQMNRAILNPMFMIAFFGPALLGIINLIVFRNAGGQLLWVLIFAIAIYFLGVVLVTIFGNVPLNELLDKTNISTASLEDLRSLRDQFEHQWNRFHMIRTVSALISFLLLIISLVQITKTTS